jgi:hypothetical protein
MAGFFVIADDEAIDVGLEWSTVWKDAPLSDLPLRIENQIST